MRELLRASRIGKLRTYGRPIHSRTRLMRRKFLVWCSFIFVAAAAILGILYVKVIPGLSSARTEPPAAETILATWLLHQSVPFEAKMSVNPAPDPSDVAAGKDLYREKCETCHAYDGGGRTQSVPMNSRAYPRCARPPSQQLLTVNYFTTSATAFVTPACPRGIFPTVRFGSS
jgi:hypothetical protein